MFPHLPAPTWQLSYLLPPVASVIRVFFHYSPFSHQSSNPFHPGNFRSTSFSFSWWTPFRKFFWQSPLFHSLDMSILLSLWRTHCLNTESICIKFVAGNFTVSYQYHNRNHPPCKQHFIHNVFESSCSVSISNWTMFISHGHKAES